MLRDKMLVLYDDTAVTGAAATETISANVFQMDAVRQYLAGSTGDPVGLNAALNDPGRSGAMILHVAVASAGLYATGGTATLDIVLYKHSTATVTSGTEVLRVRIPGIVITTPATHVQAGKHLFSIAVPPDVWGDTTNYYIGLSAIVNTQTLTAGKLNAWLGFSSQG